MLGKPETEHERIDTRDQMARKHVLMLSWSVGVVLYLSGTLLGQASLTIDEVERLLTRKVLPAMVADVVRQEGVQFELTEALRTRLRQAGATAEVMIAIEQASAARTRQRLEDTQRRLEELEQQRQTQSSKQQQLQTLLNRAREQVAAKRMTTPAGNNALETYRAILQLEPNHAEALAGLAGIKEQYIQWAEDARQQQDWDKAETFYERALRVEPQDSAVIAARQAVQEAKARARKAAEEQKAAEAAQQRQQEAQRQAEAERQRQEREAAEAERKRLDAEQRRQAEVARQRQSGMVSVPAGRFWMGCNEEVDTECWDDEKPGRTVEVAAFQIDKTEVTVAAYRACVSAGKCSPPSTGNACTWDQSGKEQHPVNCVDWAQAQAYCAWAGKRLPTEAEWEKAARGTDRRKYPWGNQGYKTAGRVANIADETSGLAWKLDGYDDGYSQTAPVKSYPDGASPYGALDMVGNVWEWTADWYDSGRKYRSVRGGSWYSYPWLARASFRDWFSPAFRYDYLGFRCAQ